MMTDARDGEYDLITVNDAVARIVRDVYHLAELDVIDDAEPILSQVRDALEEHVKGLRRTADRRATVDEWAAEADRLAMWRGL